MSKHDGRYIAPPGHFYLCLACGKWGLDRTRVGDEACFMHSVLCKGESPQLVTRPGDTNRVLANEVVDDPA